MPDVGNQKGFADELEKEDVADDSVESSDRGRSTNSREVLMIEDRNSSIHGLGEGETNIISEVEEVKSLVILGPSETK